MLNPAAAGLYQTVAHRAPIRQEINMTDRGNVGQICRLSFPQIYFGVVASGRSFSSLPAGVERFVGFYVIMVFCGQVSLLQSMLTTSRNPI